MNLCHCLTPPHWEHDVASCLNSAIKKKHENRLKYAVHYNVVYEYNYIANYKREKAGTIVM